MPTYHIEMMEGRTIEQKKKLVEQAAYPGGKLWLDRS